MKEKPGRRSRSAGVSHTHPATVGSVTASVTGCELAWPIACRCDHMGYSMGIGGEGLHHPSPAMTHALVDGCQTFNFTPDQFGVSVLRKALNGRTNRWQITGTFWMTKAEARNLWKTLIQDGAVAA